jgi:hypothetical protein
MRTVSLANKVKINPNLVSRFESIFGGKYFKSNNCSLDTDGLENIRVMQSFALHKKTNKELHVIDYTDRLKSPTSHIDTFLF